MSTFPRNAPRLTIVTPSFNQAQFLERTIDSVLSQGHPNLEYFVVDGGSTDGSAEIIKSYERHLAWWVSEPDRGQVHAINKGLQRATGEWIGWQNSDDVYLPGALCAAANAQGVAGAGVGVVAGALRMIDTHDAVLRDLLYVRPTFESLRAEGMVIANQSAWWRRNLQAHVGLLDERYSCSFDYDWFLRLLRVTAAQYIDAPLGALRLHGDSKTSLLGSRFTEQNANILRQWGTPKPWEWRAYQLRRALLTILGGHPDYVFRGLVARTRGPRP